MEVAGGAEEGFVREWTPCSHILSLIPPRIQNGLFSSELNLTCVDAVSEYIALGTNVGLVYWFDRKKGNIQRLRCENTSSPITFVKIASTVDYMVGAGNAAGQVAVFQVPREHPDTIPDSLKPKVEPKVERYTIGDLHKSSITAIEWSKNGMRLFSGDKNGVIIMTEIDFYMHLCKSMEIVNEGHEIVQLSYWGSALLVASAYRTIVCARDGPKWAVSQLGTRERKSLCALGAVFQYSYARGAGAGGVGAGGAAAYCARPGLRVWRADHTGSVLQTMLFKEAISNPLTIAELLNPCTKKQDWSDWEHNLGPLYVFREHFLVSHNERVLYILDPRTATAVAVVDELRRIISVSVNKEEIFILEGPRSLVRLAHAPEPLAAQSDEAMDLMTKSLNSLQQAVNTVRDLTLDGLDTTVPFITSVLEQPLTMFTKDCDVAKAEECFELPPIKDLPPDLSDNVLESILNQFKADSSEEATESRFNEEEIERKFKLYNAIVRTDGELIHSRRSRRCGVDSSGGSTPRTATPVRRRDPDPDPVPDVSYTTPTLMSVSGYGDLPQESDDILEKQIEEKEKILAKMLNLESLSLTSHKVKPAAEPGNPAKDPEVDVFQYRNKNNIPVQENEPVKTTINDVKPTTNDVKPTKFIDEKEKNDSRDLVPKIMKLPDTWNLDNMEIRLDLHPKKSTRRLLSLDDTLEDWEVI